MKHLLLPVLLPLMLLVTAMAEAQTRYVTDQLEVTLRSGESTQHRIITMVQSGTRLELLGSNSETGYAHVRTPQGTEGYLLLRYLSDTPSARSRLANAEQQLASQRATAEQLRAQNAELTSVRAELENQLSQLTQANEEFEAEVTHIRRTSAGALELDEANRNLRERLSRLEREYQILEHENLSLQDRTARDWFIVGAGVVLLGIIIGLIIPKIRWRRKSDWNRF